MGMGGGAPTETVTKSLPPELSHWANQYLNVLGQLVLPGGQPAPSPLPYREIASLSPQQTQGMNLVSAETYGPGGQPKGGAGQSSSPGISDLMQGVAASPTMVGNFQQNPWMVRAFSGPALSQAAALYAGLA